MWLVILLGSCLTITILLWLFFLGPREEQQATILALASELEEELAGYPYLVLVRGELILVYGSPDWELVEVIHSEEELFAFLAKEKKNGKNTTVSE
jgi:hypothetical protein